MDKSARLMKRFISVSLTRGALVATYTTARVLEVSTHLFPPVLTLSSLLHTCESTHGPSLQHTNPQASTQASYPSLLPNRSQASAHRAGPHTHNLGSFPGSSTLAATVPRHRPPARQCTEHASLRCRLLHALVSQDLLQSPWSRPRQERLALLVQPQEEGDCLPPHDGYASRRRLLLVHGTAFDQAGNRRGALRAADCGWTHEAALQAPAAEARMHARRNDGVPEERPGG